MVNANRGLDRPGNYKSNSNICFTCENSCGKCPWSAIDQETGKVKFDPVPGWTAKMVKLRAGQRGSKSEVIDTYHITDCPLYKPTRRGDCDG